jgi:hypothetical protein
MEHHDRVGKTVRMQHLVGGVTGVQLVMLHADK